MKTCLFTTRLFDRVRSAVLCLLLICGSLHGDSGAVVVSAASGERLIVTATRRLEGAGEHSEDAQRALAKLYYSQARYADCCRVSTNILKASPDDTDMEVLFAVARSKMRDESGLKDLLRLAKVKRSNQTVQIGLVEALVEFQRSEQAETILEEFINGGAANAVAYYWQTQMRYFKGDNTGAKKSIIRFFSLLSPAELEAVSSPKLVKALEMYAKLCEITDGVIATGDSSQTSGTDK